MYADDIIAGMRCQVIAGAVQEAEDWIESLPPGPVRDEQTGFVLAMQEMLEALP